MRKEQDGREESGLIWSTNSRFDDVKIVCVIRVAYLPG